MKTRVALVLCLALGAALAPRQAAAAGFSDQQLEATIVGFIKSLGDITADKPPADTPSKRRSLLTWSLGEHASVQEFMSSLMGESWSQYLPSSWSLPSFDWSRLGEFEYKSNVADFVDHNDVTELTDIQSLGELMGAAEAVDTHFCEPEAYIPGGKVPAQCVGPTVTIGVTPKVCELNPESRQIICEPAKLVLTRVPGSCVNKHKAASVWVGKECKISGTVGFKTEKVLVGGKKHTLPLDSLELPSLDLSSLSSLSLSSLFDDRP
ncbi:L-threonine dehydratase biosynthetic [Micractinium conductrix]|uniref:L-threonine dehydratase biosynthetic n=1 Tax=Micractinium conductrix TaxID=554055 RepID=A0A2P6VJD2_9CHLO|nr:L-threonine dehydratase biosynthetic [Micractinium conductrix]|eukprot:PSC74184.1 L-threonine dehydratase biosynthetic [Micractinium conductrix]